MFVFVIIIIIILNSAYRTISGCVTYNNYYTRVLVRMRTKFEDTSFYDAMVRSKSDWEKYEH